MSLRIRIIIAMSISVIILTTANIGTIIAQQTATPTSTSDLAGVRLTIDFESGVRRSEVNTNNIVPPEWITGRNARYTINIDITQGYSKRCGPYGYAGYLYVTYKGINIAVSITDNLSDTSIGSRKFSSSLPSVCPGSYSFTTINGITVPETEWRSPTVSDIRLWLRDNMVTLPGLPSTFTPTVTNTRRPSATPSGTWTPRPTATATFTATARVAHTPVALTPVIEENTLSFSGLVMIRDEHGNIVASERQGEYPLVGISDSSYVILYDGIFAYVSISSKDASPSMPLTPLPTITATLTATPQFAHTPVALTPVTEGNTLSFSGLVIIRDEHGKLVASERQGEYPLVGISDSSYVILYDGAFAYVLISSKDASPSIPLTP